MGLRTLGMTIACLLAANLPAFGQSEPPRVQILAEQFWPYSYTADSSYAVPPSGILLDFAAEVLARAGVAHEVLMLPWPRVMKHLREDPNQLVITIIRTPDREDLLHWVGPVADVAHTLYGLRGSPATRVTSLAEARSLSVATVADDVAHGYLVSKGFDRVVMTPTYLKGLEMLARGRVDLYPGNQSLIDYQCTQLPRGCGDIEAVLPLPELHQQLYFGLSSTTPPDVVERVRAAFEDLVAAGRLEAIKEAHLAQQ